jgi:hypothetical protein
VTNRRQKAIRIGSFGARARSDLAPQGIVVG